VTFNIALWEEVAEFTDIIIADYRTETEVDARAVLIEMEFGISNGDLVGEVHSRLLLLARFCSCCQPETTESQPDWCIGL
jgi:hypothetical protein